MMLTRIIKGGTLVHDGNRDSSGCAARTRRIRDPNENRSVPEFIQGNTPSNSALGYYQRLAHNYYYM